MCSWMTGDSLSSKSSLYVVVLKFIRTFIEYLGYSVFAIFRVLFNHGPYLNIDWAVGEEGSCSDDLLLSSEMIAKVMTGQIVFDISI